MAPPTLCALPALQEDTPRQVQLTTQGPTCAHRVLREPSQLLLGLLLALPVIMTPLLPQLACLLVQHVQLDTRMIFRLIVQAMKFCFLALPSPMEGVLCMFAPQKPILFLNITQLAVPCIVPIPTTFQERHAFPAQPL